MSGVVMWQEFVLFLCMLQNIHVAERPKYVAGKSWIWIIRNEMNWHPVSVLIHRQKPMQNAVLNFANSTNLSLFKCICEKSTNYCFPIPPGAACMHLINGTACLLLLLQTRYSKALAYVYIYMYGCVYIYTYTHTRYTHTTHTKERPPLHTPDPE